MKIKNMSNTFKIILSVGDESGVGPEIILKALCSHQIPKNVDFILVGSKKNLHNTYTHLKSLEIYLLFKYSKCNFLSLLYIFYKLVYIQVFRIKVCLKLAYFPSKRIGR